MSIKSLYPDIRPSLNLDFANSKALDGRITFTRNSTATYVGANGLIQTAQRNAPRFDHDPVTGESLGLLIEEQRTNIINNTENVGSWNTATATQETANPIKGLYTHRVTDRSNDGDSPHLFGSNYTTGKVTMSMYIDAVNSTSTLITMYLFGGGYISTTWDISTGIPVWNGSFNINGSNHSNGSQQVIDCGGGIYRLVITADYGGSSTASRFYITPNLTDTGYVIVAGIQMEQGAFPTSYIPTSGSSVTRGADFASITGTNFSDWYNQNEGTIYVDDKMANTSTYWGSVVGFMGQTDNNYRILVFRNYTGLTDQFELYNNGQQVAFDIPRTNTEYHKVSIALKNNDVSLSFNDDYLLTDTSVTLPIVDRLEFGSTLSSSFNVRYVGHIKKLAYYPKRLTNAQLQLLTK